MKTTHKRPTTRPRFRWLTAGIAAVWLVLGTVFFVPQVENLETTAAVVTAVGAWIIFCVIYIVGLGFYGGGELPPRAMFLMIGPLVALTVVLWLTVGSVSIITIAYITSVLIFAISSLLPALIIGALVTTLVSVASLYIDASVGEYVVLPLWFAFFSVAVVRVADDIGRQRQREKELMDMEADRERIANDIHNRLGSSLAAMAMKSEAAAKLAESEPEWATAQAQEISTIARDALDELRYTVAHLRCRNLGDEVAAAQQALEAAGIEVRLDVDEQVLESGTFERIFSWIIRESVSNVIRHSHAHTCVIAIDDLKISITDDGVGIARERLKSEELFTALRQRVQASGGVLQIVSPVADEHGTRITAYFLEQKQQA